MEYRRDIDGLRCFAVVSVLLYHLNPNLLPGGFTGVDIFFVISGFLITRLLRKEIEQGNLSLSRFYSRRIRRIFPALFSVLLATFIFAVIALEPNAYSRFMEEFRYSALQISNFKFARELDYFDPGHDLSLLLHTWSLGVEEQFYLLWPLLLYSGYRLFKNRSWILILGVSLGSLFLSEHLAKESPQQAFYLLHSRAWELGVGGILTFLNSWKYSFKWLDTILASIGFFMIFAGFTQLNQFMTFPGINGLLPVVGAGLLIYAGGRHKTILSPILENMIVVFIGKISYSVYLWHWPLIIIYKISTGHEIDLVSGTVIGAITFLLATLSYYFVEQPFRKKANSQHTRTPDLHRQILTGALILIALVCFVYSYRFEENQNSTVLTIEIRGIESPSDFEKEYITVYWKTRYQSYDNERSHILDYADYVTEEDGIYHFSCELPPLHTIDSIRLDPLRKEGVVDLLKVQVTSGLLGNTRTYSDFSKITEDAAGSSGNLIISQAGDNLRIQSLSADPYFDLFPKSPNLHENSAIFFAMIVTGGFVFLGFYCTRRRKTHTAVVMYGLALVCFCITASFRGQFSTHSNWRFIERVSSEYWRSAMKRTDLHAMNNNGTSQVVLWGDSHVENYGEPVNQWAKAKNLKLKLLYVPACPPLAINEDEISSLNDIAYTNYVGCFKHNEKMLTQIENDRHIEYVFLAMRYEFYLNHPSMLFRSELSEQVPFSLEEFFLHTFDNTIARLQQAGKKIILLGQVPVLKERPDQCIKRDQTLLTYILKLKPTCDIDDTFSDNALQPGRTMFEKTAMGDTAIYYFRPEQYISSIFGENGALKYQDNNHLNSYGAHLLAPRLVQELTSF